MFFDDFPGYPQRKKMVILQFATIIIQRVTCLSDPEVRSCGAVEAGMAHATTGAFFVFTSVFWWPNPWENMGKYGLQNVTDDFPIKISIKISIKIADFELPSLMTAV